MAGLPDFPFRSLLPEYIGEDPIAIWIASTSHAVHQRYSQETVFPNEIYRFFRSDSDGCFVINGSAEGMTIAGHMALLDKCATIYQPDVTVLYLVVRHPIT